MFCFRFICWKKNTLSSSISASTLKSTLTTSTETSMSGEKSTMKKQHRAKTRSRKKTVSLAANLKSSKTLAVTPRTASMKLLAGSSPCKTSNTNKKTTSSSGEKSVLQRKITSLKPTLQPGTSHIEQIDTKAQTSLQSSMRTTAIAERKSKALLGQVKKTGAKKRMASNRLNMEKDKTTNVRVEPSSELPETKHITVKEPDEMAKLNSSFALSTVKENEHNQGRKEKRTQMTPFNWKNTENVNQKLMELNISNVKEKKITSPPPSDGMSLVPVPFEGNTKSLTPADENSMTLILPSVPDKQVLPGGLPNLGNSCYINASLQCLLTADAFCEELSNLLDISSHTIEDTFLRCFAELSRLRNGCDVRGDLNRDSVLLALINSATAKKREFTIYDQNDAHEFLCHCLTSMERSLQKHVHPRCPVKTNFKFKMRNIITCSSCGAEQNNKLDVFNHISVPLVYNSVDQCLYHLVNEATAVESKCSVCEGESASSRWTFHTLPRFLILQLNRFKLSERHTVIKLDTSVDIQPELQIDCRPQSDLPGSDRSTSEAKEIDRNEPCGPTSVYRLICVLSHFGSSAEYGHYVSDCYNHSSHEWMSYDDDQVTPTTQTDVLQRRSSNAYVLLYERLDTG